MSYVKLHWGKSWFHPASRWRDCVIPQTQAHSPTPTVTMNSLFSCCKNVCFLLGITFSTRMRAFTCRTCWLWLFACALCWECVLSVVLWGLNMKKVLWSHEWVCFCDSREIHGSWSLCVSVPVLTSVCFVFGLSFGMQNMPAFEVQSLWNENAAQGSNTVERDCVRNFACAGAPACFGLCSLDQSSDSACGLKNKNPPVPSPSFLFVCFVLSVLILPHLPLFLTSPVLCFIRLFQGGSKHDAFSTQHSGRHLLDFSPEAETEVVMGPDPHRSGSSEIADR